MNWNELAAKISKMPPEQQQKDVLVFDDNEGEFSAIMDVRTWDDPDGVCHGVMYLQPSSSWWEPEK